MKQGPKKITSEAGTVDRKLEEAIDKERQNERHTMKDKLEAEADASCYPPTW